ncbi:hypothetical protein CDX22_08225, partial [Campylobacter coli]|nr:hypothetical protein [Campylobacter coli]
YFITSIDFILRLKICKDFYVGVPLEVSKGLSPLSQDGIYFRREVKNVSKMFPTFSKLPLLF